MARYTRKTVGGKDYYTFGDYDIEADKARAARLERQLISGDPSNSDTGNAVYDWVVVRDDRPNMKTLSRLADQQYYAAQSAKALNLTTGGQTGFEADGTTRIGTKTKTGGRFLGAKSLLRGKTGAAMLGGA